MPPRPSGRPFWLIPTLSLLVVLPIGGAIYTAVAESRTDGPPKLSRTGSKVVDAVVDTALPIGDEPTTYTITYRLERYDLTRVQVTEETTEVRRPFDARVTTRVDGKVVATRTSRLGALTIGTGQGPRSLVSPPAPATSDLRLRNVLPDALADGHLELRERRSVLDTTCQVYRSGRTVIAGTLIPVKTAEGEHADFCVDGDGLLLEEVWFKGGRAIQRRVATERRVGIPLADEHFELPDEQPMSVEQGNGILRSIDPQSGFEGSSYRLAADPPGFTYIGRFVVQPPKLETFRDPTRQDDASPQQVSVVDVWERGPDLLTLAQTIVADADVFPPDDKTAKRVDLGIAGLEAKAFLDLRANEIRLGLPEGRFLRLIGTLPRDQLTEIASGLRAESGTGIKVLEP